MPNLYRRLSKVGWLDMTQTCKQSETQHQTKTLNIEALISLSHRFSGRDFYLRHAAPSFNRLMRMTVQFSLFEKSSLADLIRWISWNDGTQDRWTDRRMGIGERKERRRRWAKFPDLKSGMADRKQMVSCKKVLNLRAVRDTYFTEKILHKFHLCNICSLNQDALAIEQF